MPLSTRNKSTFKEIGFSILCIGVLGGLLFYKSPAMLSRLDGGILLCGFGLFMFRLYKILQKHHQSAIIDMPAKEPMTKAWFHLGLGCLILPAGGHLVITSATTIAFRFGVSEAFISLFAIALGTSLPELMTTVMAAVKHKAEMALGNIVGSNIFNILLILGTSSLLNPVAFNPILVTDLVLLLGVSVLLFFMVLLDKDKLFERWHGGVFLMIYLGYIGYIFYRG